MTRCNSSQSSHGFKVTTSISTSPEYFPLIAVTGVGRFINLNSISFPITFLVFLSITESFTLDFLPISLSEIFKVYSPEDPPDLGTL